MIGYVLIAMCLHACSVFQDGGNDPYVGLDEEFQLRVGETIGFMHVDQQLETEVTFMEVIQDSRCPLNVDCVWQGEVEVAFDLLTEDVAEALEYRGFLGPNGEGVLRQSFGDVYELQLLRVDPYPDQEVRLEGVRLEEAVVATLRIVQKGTAD